MKVEHILEMLHGKDKNEEIAMTFFFKDEAELRTEAELTDKEWSEIVLKYEQNDHIDQVAIETFAEISWKVVNEREKTNVGSTTVN